MLPGQRELTLVTLRSQVSPKSIENQDAHDFAHYLVSFPNLHDTDNSWSGLSLWIFIYYYLQCLLLHPIYVTKFYNTAPVSSCIGIAKYIITSDFFCKAHQSSRFLKHNVTRSALMPALVRHNDSHTTSYCQIFFFCFLFI